MRRRIPTTVIKQSEGKGPERVLGDNINRSDIATYH